MRSLNRALCVSVMGMVPLMAQADELTPLADMPAGTYVLDKSHASIIWKVNHLGLSHYTARFTDFSASVALDPADVSKSSLKATIDPTSIKTDFVGEKDFDKKLTHGEDWFNGGKFPAITFESTKIEQQLDDTGEIHGNLTMLGVTKPLVLDATFNGAYAQAPFSKKAVIGVSAQTVVKRSDWGFDTYVPMIGDEVLVLIEAELVKED